MSLLPFQVLVGGHGEGGCPGFYASKTARPEDHDRENSHEMREARTQLRSGTPTYPPVPARCGILHAAFRRNHRDRTNRPACATAPALQRKPATRVPISASKTR